MTIILFSFMVMIGIMFYLRKKKEQEEQIIDTPISFGYKKGWLAIKSTHHKAIAEHLCSKRRPCNWKKGLSAKDEIFISPPIDGWVIVTNVFLDMGQDKSQAFLCGLSKKFTVAQYFYTHRVIELHTWVIAKQGKLVRAYSYIGEQGEILLNQGPLTTVEKELQVQLPKEEEWLPSEEDVITIANNWSINPTTLGERSTKALGLIGNPFS